MLSPTAPNAIKLSPVNSSKLFALGYDHGLFILRAEFKPSKATYDYFDVPPEVYASLMAAPSLGTYFGIHIAGARGATPPFKFGKVGTPAHLVLWEAALSEGDPTPAAGAPSVADLNTTQPRELPQQQPRTIEAAPEPEYIAPVDLPSDQAGLEARAVAVEVETRALVIVPQGRRAVLTTRTPEGYAHAVAMLLAKKDEKKRALEQVETIKGPATKAWQAACAFASKVAASYDASINVLDQAVTDYRNEVKEAERKAADAERAAHQARLDEEARENARLAQDQAARDAEALRAAGQHEVAREVEAAPVYVRREVAPTAVARTAIPTVAGARVSGTWKFEVRDPALVPRFYMGDIAMALMRAGCNVTEEKLGPLVSDIAKAFAQFHSLDEVKIGGRVRPLKEAAVDLIPGVHVWFDEKTGSTGR
jgi:hypothetical protein